MLARIGLEAGPLSQWLYAGLNEAGFAVELLETWHVRDAFKAMPVKTDRKDARGIAQLMRLGWFRPVHCKSMPGTVALDPTQPKSHSPPRPPAPTTASNHRRPFWRSLGILLCRVAGGADIKSPRLSPTRDL